MKYTRSIVAGAVLISLITSGVVMANSHKNVQPVKAVNNSAETTLTPEQFAATSESTEATPVAPVAPTPVASTPVTPPAPQTSVEWYQALKTKYSEDEVSCVLGIMIKFGIANTTDVSVLQSKLDYAVNTYGTPCMALGKLSNNPQTY